MLLKWEKLISLLIKDIEISRSMWSLHRVDRVAINKWFVQSWCNTWATWSLENLVFFGLAKMLEIE